MVMNFEAQQHLFEPFFTTKPMGEGTGLGLAVVQGITTRHGGKNVVDSAQDIGSRFDVYFPVGQIVSASIPATATAEAKTVTLLESKDEPNAAPKSAPKCRVLYIDDDEALALLTAIDQDFDVVISDYNMPG